MYICMYSCNHTCIITCNFMQTVQLKCLKFNDIYFLQEMNLLVLNPTVLTMVGHYRADVFGVPAQGDNDAMRHYAYHQFVLWRLGKLGTCNRRVIPSCCMWQIRQTFPSENGQYSGFKVHRLG